MASKDDLQMRVAELERKVAFMMKELGLTYESKTSDLASQAVIDLIYQGKKIEAVKVHREETGLGLKEAKDTVDEIERRVKSGNY
jgi:large subunit ribosomal protein L7/L12